MPHNVSGDIVPSKDIVQAVITAGQVGEIGIVAYSGAELQVINTVTGSAPFIYDSLDKAVEKLIPGGVKPIVEQRVVSGGETVMVSTEVPTTPEKQEESDGKTYSAQIQLLFDQNEKLSKDNKSLTEQLAAEKNTVSTQKEKIAELESKLKLQIGAQTDNETLTKKVNDLIATNKNLEKMLNEQQEENAKLTTEIETLKKESSALINKGSESTAAKDKEIADLKKQIEEQKVALSKKDEELSAQDNSNSEEVEAKLKGMEDKLKEANAGLERFRGILNKTVKENGLTWDAKQGFYIPVPTSEGEPV